jgi:SAM-dependent methyltransferase
VNLRDAWEGEAEAWAAWARTPDHDSFFWHHGLPSLLALLPPPGAGTIDVGCGEGRLSRALAKLGHHVVGVDGSATLTRLAATHEQASPVLHADAAVLPARDGAFDLAVASMSLQDVDDVDAVVGEIARVLAPGGRLCASIVHPINSAGVFAERTADSPFVIADSYLEERRYVEVMERDGLTMTYHSLHHPFETYSRALEDAGLLLEAVREPPVGDALVDLDPRRARWQRIPVFLFFRAAKPVTA